MAEEFTFILPQTTSIDPGQNIAKTYHFQATYNNPNQEGTEECLTPEEGNRGLLYSSPQGIQTVCGSLWVREVTLVTALLALGSTEVAGGCQSIWSTTRARVKTKPDAEGKPLKYAHNSLSNPWLPQRESLRYKEENGERESSSGRCSCTIY